MALAGLPPRLLPPPRPWVEALVERCEGLAGEWDVWEVAVAGRATQRLQAALDRREAAAAEAAAAGEAAGS